MITTTNYEENGFADIITGLIKIYNPKIVVELGTQQGASALIIGKALGKEGHLYTYDLFNKKYSKPPFAKTHADYEEAVSIKFYGLESKVSIQKADAFEVHKKFDKVDMLHVDLCNYYSNVETILRQWYKKVEQAIILEGGGYNKWQRKNGFAPFSTLLNELFIVRRYKVTILKKNEDYALSLLLRKEHIS